MSYIPEYHENYYRVEGTAYNQGKIGIGTVNPVDLLHVSGGNFRLNGTGYFGGDLNITGNLNVYGTAAQFAVQQIFAEDKAIELNVQTGTPIGGSGLYSTTAISNDAGAEDGGLILRSTQGDKVIAYETTTPASGWVSNLRWVVSGNYGKDTLSLTDTNANVGMTIGGDTNLYRSAADTLRTDDNLVVNGNATLGDATSDTHTVNGTLTNNLPDNTATVVDLKEGTNSYIKLDTTNASELVTIGATPKFTSLNTTDATSSTAAGATFAGGVGVAKKLFIGAVSSNKDQITITDTTAGAGLTIGADTNLYRSAANTLKTDDTFTTDSYVIKSISAAVSAAGTNQGTATALTKDINNVTSSTAGTQLGVILPTAIAGMEITIINNSANTINIYPAVGGQINALGTNIPLTLTAGSRSVLIATTTTQWYS